MENAKNIALWQDRIKEIEERGNCSNGHPHAPQDYFGVKHTPEQMIEFCNRMIEILKNQSLTSK